MACHVSFSVLNKHTDRGLSQQSNFACKTANYGPKLVKKKQKHRKYHMINFRLGRVKILTLKTYNNFLGCFISFNKLRRLVKNKIWHATVRLHEHAENTKYTHWLVKRHLHCRMPKGANRFNMHTHTRKRSKKIRTPESQLARNFNYHTFQSNFMTFISVSWVQRIKNWVICLMMSLVPN